MLTYSLDLRTRVVTAYHQPGARQTADYDLIEEDDQIDILGLTTFAPGQPLQVRLRHADTDFITINHTCDEGQIGWFRADSALNLAKLQESGVAV